MLLFLVKRFFWGLFFVGSLCAVNVLMLLNAVLLLPFSPIRYRKINEMFTHVLWPYWSYGIEYLAGNRLHFYGEKVSGQENVFLLANHTYWCDWIIAFAFATRFNRVGVVKVMVKELIRWIPGVGTGLMGCGCIFLSRHWPADRPAFIRACSPLLHHPLPFWLFSHPEGSRVTPKKLLESQAFAAERGLPKLNNVLLPRIKGFHTTVQTLGDKIDAIYDLTIAYSKKPPGPVTILCGPSNLDVHIYVMRIPMKDVPRGEKEVAQWLYELFEKKDKLMEHWKRHGVFPGPEQALPYDRRPCERAFLTWTPVMVATLVGTGVVTQRLWRYAMQRLGY